MKKKEEKENAQKGKAIRKTEKKSSIKGRRGIPRKNKPGSPESSSSDDAEKWVANNSDSSLESFDEDEMAELVEKVESKTTGKANVGSKNAINDLIEIDDWVVIKFSLTEQQGKFCQFLGQVVKEENGKYVRSTSTRENREFIFTFPKEDDISEFTPE